MVPLSSSSSSLSVSPSWSSRRIGNTGAGKGAEEDEDDGYSCLGFFVLGSFDGDEELGGVLFFSLSFVSSVEVL